MEQSIKFSWNLLLRPDIGVMPMLISIEYLRSQICRTTSEEADDTDARRMWEAVRGKSEIGEEVNVKPWKVSDFKCNGVIDLAKLKGAFIWVRKTCSFTIEESQNQLTIEEVTAFLLKIATQILEASFEPIVGLKLVCILEVPTTSVPMQRCRQGRRDGEESYCDTCEHCCCCCER